MDKNCMINDKKMNVLVHPLPPILFPVPVVNSRHRTQKSQKGCKISPASNLLTSFETEQFLLLFPA